ncbi:hypothetical protein CAPTEDRAFT_226077 [Capitella teleta]|uniref:Uncharacterized protein n=1 Tax=Capitella teleta TaxID=283909 RepID=R7URN7_CAPTE|nr:hypothetical protein CAPTEDRAFT_226077 [Capitella teleta]|eukprot:ELU08818.1 hypothetical protein CAPTEDRAFT_226077 [Capitella teleta]
MLSLARRIRAISQESVIPRGIDHFQKETSFHRQFRSLQKARHVQCVMIYTKCGVRYDIPRVWSTSARPTDARWNTARQQRTAPNFVERCAEQQSMESFCSDIDAGGKTEINEIERTEGKGSLGLASIPRISEPPRAVIGCCETVTMPTFLPVGPTTYVDNTGYTPFERRHWLSISDANQTRRVRRRTRKKSPPNTEQLPENIQSDAIEKVRSKDDLDLDFSGISNMMRGMTFKKSRKWRLKSEKDEVGSSRNAKTEPTRAWVDSTKEDDDKDDIEFNKWALRRPRSSSFIKYKYPKELHKRSQQMALEENIPQCMRHNSNYSNLPERQSCWYDPYRSVTKVKVHSIQSSNLPHPNTSPLKTKQRPMSAPPSYKTTRTGVGSTNGTATNNNGVYHVIYEEKRTVTEVRKSVELEGPVVMKGDYSDEELCDIPSGMQDTIVSLEDFEDEDEGSAKNPQIAHERPLSPEPHCKDSVESADEMYDIKFESDPESLVDETTTNNRPQTARSRSRSKILSDAEEVDSDY